MEKRKKIRLTVIIIAVMTIMVIAFTCATIISGFSSRNLLITIYGVVIGTASLIKLKEQN